jgi:arylsulfatase A-like enzyme
VKKDITLNSRFVNPVWREELVFGKMNVLFIAVDDLRPQLGCYGVDWTQSPNIDKLAANATLFERAYCQQAVCAPSRASVLSGCRPDTTTIYDLATPLRSVMPDVVTLPQHFKNNGYETVSVGKIYHHSNDDMEGWSKAPILNKGDWLGRGYLTEEAVEAMSENDGINVQRGDKRRGLGPAFEAADVPDNAYHDGMDADTAIEELGRLGNQEHPFFMALGFHKPHLPFNAPKKYWDLYDDVPLAENPFEPENATQYSLTNYGELRGYFGMPKEGPIPDALARQLVKGYAACVSYMDAQVGRVLDELDRLGLRENTVVLLWGDHGWKLGEHASWCKHSNFEIDARAPLIVRAPGMTSGQKTMALTEFFDMFPSLCELCGLDLPDHLEGSSFVPLLKDPNCSWKRAAFSQYPRGKVMGYTMRTNRFRYTEWQDRQTREILARELYDHDRDAQENVNAVEKDIYVNAVRELTQLMA